MTKKRKRQKRTKAVAEARALKSANTKVFAPGEAVPDDYWRELATQHEQVSLRVMRRNHKGHLATCWSGLLFKVLEMSALDSWIQAGAGGSGMQPYTVEVRDPNDLTNMLVQYCIHIEGPVRPAIPLPKAPDPNEPWVMPQGMEAFDTPTDEPMFTFVQADAAYSAPPVYSEGYPPHPAELAPFSAPAVPSEVPMSNEPVQRAVSMPSGPGTWHPGPGRAATGVASIPSDQLMREKAQETAVALERERVERRADQQRFEEERTRAREAERTMREQLAQIETQRREDLHRAELKALEARFESLQQRPAAAPEKSPIETLALLAGALAPLAPVFAAMVSSGKELQAASLAAQSAQSANMLQMVVAGQQRPVSDPIDTITKLLVPLAPLLAPLFAQRSSSADAGVITAAAEAQASNTAIIAQLLGAIAESGQPEAAKSLIAEILPHLPAVGDMIYRAASTWRQESAALQQQQQPQAPRQLPANAVQRPAQPVPVAAAAPAPRPINATPATPATTAPAYEPATPSYGTVEPEGEIAAPAPASVAADARLVEPPPAPMPDDSQSMTSYPVELPEHLLAMLPDGLRGPGWKHWLRALHRGEGSAELGTDLAELINDAIASELLPEGYAERMEMDPEGSLQTLAGMLPACVRNPPYAQSIIAFAMVRLEELAPAEDDEDEGDGGDGEHDSDDGVPAGQAA